MSTQVALAQVESVVVKPSAKKPRLLRVMTFGSCRVHTPIHVTSKDGLVASTYARFRFPHKHFFHSTEENLQFLRILKGQLTPPAHLMPMLFVDGEFDPPEDAAAVLAEADAYLLEVSSEKLFELDGWFLQVSRIQRRTIGVGGDHSRAWWRAIMEQSPAAADLVPAMAEELAALGAPLDPRLEAALPRLAWRVSSLEETVEALRAFRAEAGAPVFVVTHVDALTPSGEAIKSRRQLIQTVVEAARKLDMPVFEPGVFIRRFGQPSVMLNEGRDTYEYAEDFRPIAGREFVLFMMAGLPEVTLEILADAVSARAEATAANKEAAAAHKEAAAAAKDAAAARKEAEAARKETAAAKKEAEAVRREAEQARKDADTARTEAAARKTVARPPRSLQPGARLPTTAEFETDVQAFLSARLAAEGERGSGLYAAYARKLQLGVRLYSDADLAVCEMIATGPLSGYDRYVQSGPALGLTSLLVSAHGFEAVALQGEPARFRCMEALRAALGNKYPGVRSRSTLLRRTFPSEMRGLDVSNSLFLGVGLRFSATDADLEACIKALGAFRGAVIDLAGFVQAHETPGARQRLLERLRAVGFGDPVALPAEYGLGGEHVLIQTR